MPNEGSDKNTAQPVYRVSVPVFLEKSCLCWHTVHGKSSDHLCICAVGVSSDSDFPSTIAHWGAVDKC